ncbi:unnamed protein product [Amoebophrya sp. A120]|nr:unnamed protein product [Amoebophrya sp. A120]|eukprot:GSA120T00014076001.1
MEDFLTGIQDISSSASTSLLPLSHPVGLDFVVTTSLQNNLQLNAIPEDKQIVFLESSFFEKRTIQLYNLLWPEYENLPDRSSCGHYSNRRAVAGGAGGVISASGQHGSRGGRGGAASGKSGRGSRGAASNHWKQMNSRRNNSRGRTSGGVGVRPTGNHVIEDDNFDSATTPPRRRKTYPASSYYGRGGGRANSCSSTSSDEESSSSDGDKSGTGAAPYQRSSPGAAGQTTPRHHSISGSSSSSTSHSQHSASTSQLAGLQHQHQQLRPRQFLYPDGAKGCFLRSFLKCGILAGLLLSVSSVASVVLLKSSGRTAQPAPSRSGTTSTSRHLLLAKILLHHLRNATSFGALIAAYNTLLYCISNKSAYVRGTYAWFAGLVCGLAILIAPEDGQHWGTVFCTSRVVDVALQAVYCSIADHWKKNTKEKMLTGGTEVAGAAQQEQRELHQHLSTGNPGTSTSTEVVHEKNQRTTTPVYFKNTPEAEQQEHQVVDETNTAKTSSNKSPKSSSDETSRSNSEIGAIPYLDLILTFFGTWRVYHCVWTDSSVLDVRLKNIIAREFGGALEKRLKSEQLPFGKSVVMKWRKENLMSLALSLKNFLNCLSRSVKQFALASLVPKVALWGLVRLYILIFVKKFGARRTSLTSAGSVLPSGGIINVDEGTSSFFQFPSVASPGSPAGHQLEKEDNNIGAERTLDDGKTTGKKSLAGREMNGESASATTSRQVQPPDVGSDGGNKDEKSFPPTATAGRANPSIGVCTSTSTAIAGSFGAAASSAGTNTTQLSTPGANFIPAELQQVTTNAPGGSATPTAGVAASVLPGDINYSKSATSTSRAGGLARSKSSSALMMRAGAETTTSHKNLNQLTQQDRDQIAQDLQQHSLHQSKLTLVKRRKMMFEFFRYWSARNLLPTILNSASTTAVVRGNNTTGASTASGMLNNNDPSKNSTFFHSAFFSSQPVLDITLSILRSAFFYATYLHIPVLFLQYYPKVPKSVVAFFASFSTQILKDGFRRMEVARSIVAYALHTIILLKANGGAGAVGDAGAAAGRATTFKALLPRLRNLLLFCCSWGFLCHIHANPGALPCSVYDEQNKFWVPRKDFLSPLTRSLLQYFLDQRAIRHKPLLAIQFRN